MKITAKSQKFYSGLVSLLVILAMLTSAVPVQAGDTLPAVGQGERGANQPSLHGYRAQEFKDWNPQTDPYAPYLRARVPLQERIAPFAPTQARPNLNPQVEMFNLAGDYGNAFFENYQYNDQFSLYLFNFWQYVDYYGSWHGMATESVPPALYNASDSWQFWFFEFGILNLPNPAYTNAAHKNGALSLATLFLPRAGQFHRDWIVQAPDGSFPVADKLIEAANYFGYDGYFINQETAITTAEIPIYKQFLKYMRDRGLYVQWYDSVINTTGAVSYQRAFNNLNSPFVLDPIFGRVSDSIFIDYPWNAARILTSETTANSLGLDPLKTVYAGVEAGGDRFGAMRNDLRNAVNSATGDLRVSVAMLGAEFVYNGLDEDLGTSSPEQNNRAKPEYQPQVFERERRWWSGPRQDPSQTGRLQPTGSYWDGVAHWITERSVLDSSFAATFNTGHGLRYFVNGEVSNPNEWANINLQDILPSWQWWLTSTGTRLAVDFDYTLAWQGGSSLAVSGVLDGSNDLRLYKTDIPLVQSSALTLTYFTNQAAGSPSNLRAALVFKDNPSVFEYVDVGAVQTQGWNSAVLDLSTYAGRRLALLGLNFTSNEVVSDFRVNIGGLKLTDGSEPAVGAPTGFRIDRVYDTTEMLVAWDLDPYEVVKQYHLYGRLSDGRTVFLGGTYDDVYYIKSLYGETGLVELLLRAVGVDGVEGPAAVVSYDFSREARNINVTPSPDLYYAGYLDVSWDAPLAGGQVNLELTLENKVDSPVFNQWIPLGSSQARIAVPLANFEKYALRLWTSGPDGESPGIVVTGNLADVVPPEPYSGRFMFGTGTTTRAMNLDTPTAYDWWRLYSYNNGVVIPGRLESSVNNVTYKVRGKHNLSSATTGTNAMNWTFADKTIISLVLEDYRGNLSDPSSTILLFNPNSTVSTTDMPSEVLRSAVQAQVGGLTYAQVVNYTGTIDLSGLAVGSLTGLNLLRSASEINLSNTGITSIPANTFNGNMLRKLDLRNNPNLAVINSAFTGMLYPAEIDIRGSNALTSINLSNSSFEKLTADAPSMYPNLVTVNLSGSRFDLTPGTPEQQFLSGLPAGASVAFTGQRPAAYLSPLAENHSILQTEGMYALDNLVRVVTARGTDFRLLQGAPFVAVNYDVARQLANRGLQVLITNPQGQLVNWINKQEVGIWTVSFRSLAAGQDLGSVQVHVIYDYDFSGFLPPYTPNREYRVNQNSTVPIKFTFTDRQGQPVSDISVWVYTAPVQGGVVIGPESPAVATNRPPGDNRARYDAVAGQYIFNLNTKSLAKGTYQVRAFFGDATSQSFILVVR